MPLIDVTIDVRDLDPDTGPVPASATVAFARLSPAVENGGVLVTTNPVNVPLVAGSGFVRLKAATVYLVRFLGFGGFPPSFTILTGTAPTTLGQLWQTGQVDPAGFGARPVPQTVEQALADLRALISGSGGAGGAGVQYQQATPAGQWSIPHSIGRRPAVALYQPSGEAMLADIVASPSLVVVTFANPTAGSAVLT